MSQASPCKLLDPSLCDSSVLLYKRLSKIFLLTCFLVYLFSLVFLLQFQTYQFLELLIFRLSLITLREFPFYSVWHQIFHGNSSCYQFLQKVLSPHLRSFLRIPVLEPPLSHFTLPLFPRHFSTHLVCYFFLMH